MKIKFYFKFSCLSLKLLLVFATAIATTPCIAMQIARNSYCLLSKKQTLLAMRSKKQVGLMRSKLLGAIPKNK
jgi:hypothetical protein